MGEVAGVIGDVGGQVSGVVLWAHGLREGAILGRG
jgi:hypothetical protein